MGIGSVDTILGLTFIPLELYDTKIKEYATKYRDPRELIILISKSKLQNIKENDFEKCAKVLK